MKKGLTELVFILDRSGSMCGLEADTIGGFNSMIEKQKKEEGEAFVTTVLFSDKSVTVHDRVKIADVAPMTQKEYYVGGCTALIDAIGEAVDHIGNIHKYARREDVPEHTVFVITTDGMENASHRYTAEKVKSMVEHQKSKYGWEFIFLGANIDSVETVEKFGIDKDRVADYVCDSSGIDANYQALDETIRCLRRSGSINSDWNAGIKKNYKKKR